MSTDPLHTDPAKYAFVQMYSSRGFADPWDIIDAYETVLQATAKHPQKGSAAISRIVDLPRSTIRRWVDDDAVPYPYQGLQTAVSHGWLDLTEDGEMTQALVELTAHVFGSGSLHNEKYRPRISAGRDVPHAEIHDAYHAVGVSSAESTPDDPERPMQIVATNDASVLGRVLVVLGVPLGREARGQEGVPPILDHVSDDMVRSFIKIYLRHRTIDRGSGNRLRVLVNRPNRFKNGLARHIRDVTDADIQVYQRGVSLSSEAADDLGFAPIPETET